MRVPNCSGNGSCREPPRRRQPVVRNAKSFPRLESRSRPRRQSQVSLKAGNCPATTQPRGSCDTPPFAAFGIDVYHSLTRTGAGQRRGQFHLVVDAIANQIGPRFFLRQRVNRGNHDRGGSLSATTTSKRKTLHDDIRTILKPLANWLCYLLVPQAKSF